MPLFKVEYEIPPTRAIYFCEVEAIDAQGAAIVALMDMNNPAARVRKVTEMPVFTSKAADILILAKCYMRHDKMCITQELIGELCDCGVAEAVAGVNELLKSISP